MMRVGSLAFFEVDAALRPEGKAGALTRTLESHVAYYKRWAKTWEFQALLKARAMTGDMQLADDYIAAVKPMVWQAAEREDFVPEVQAMRRRVESLVPEDLRARNLKLGSGSLRDVEFAVQLLQMVHGRIDESLRVMPTVDALAALTAGGYVGRDDGANLGASYQFLRLLEHRLQLQRLSRTHLLPEFDDDEGMRWLARAAHIRREGELDATGVLREQIRHQSLRVRRLHEKLFYRPLLEAATRFNTQELTLSDSSAERRLAALGYAKPDRAMNHIRALSNAPGRRGQIQLLILPQLLETISRTPDPDAGLLNYRRLCDVMEDADWFLRLLRDDGVVAQRLMKVLGTSEYIANMLMRSPEVIHQYSDGPDGPKLCDVRPEDVAKGLIASTVRQQDLKRAVAAARSHRRAELVRIASADVLGLMDVPQVCRALSSVWAAVLNAALTVVINASEAERGEPAPARIAVIGMGRLGGGELGYGSDADVLFVCQPNPDVDEAAAVRWSQTIAENVRTMLGSPSDDPPLEVDTGLRPEGRNGKVVRTLTAYAAYYDQWAQRGRYRRCCAPIRWPATRTWVSTSCTWPTASAIRRAGCPPKPSRRSAGSRPAWTPSGYHVARTRPRTPNSAAADSPTSSGRCSCCSCATPTGTGRCTTRPRWSRWMRSVLPSCSARTMSRCSRTRGSPRPRPATLWSWSVANRSTSCPVRAGSCVRSPMPPAGRRIRPPSSSSTTCE